MKDKDFDSLKCELKRTYEKLRVLQKLYHSETGINFLNCQTVKGCHIEFKNATYDDETGQFYYDGNSYSNIDDLVEDIEHDLEAAKYKSEEYQRRFGG